MAALKHTQDYIEQVPVMAYDMIQSHSVDEKPEPLKPLNSFYELSPTEWDFMIHAAIPFRRLHEKLILTRCTILEKYKLRAKLSELDALD